LTYLSGVGRLPISEARTPAKFGSEEDERSSSKHLLTLLEGAMSSKIWEATGATRELMEYIIKEHLPHLATVDDKIAILFKEKATKSGGQVIFGKSKKASAVIQALTKERGELVFLLEIGNDEWLTFSDETKMAALHHLLCCCGVEEKEDGTERYFVRPPDASVFYENIKLFGFWMKYDTEDDTAEESASAIEELFAEEEESASEDEGSEE